MSVPSIQLDLLVLGGGVAGLWLLDEAVRNGRHAVLLESHALGSGQTIASQGIIHGGLKYTLQGLLTSSAGAIREMPDVWRACLEGRRKPDLCNVFLRASHCHLWRTQSVGSRLGMIGARVGLLTAPVALNDEDRPDVLAECPGGVSRLDEPVIDPAGLLSVLASPHQERLVKVDDRVRFVEEGGMFHVELHAGHRQIHFFPRAVVLTGGAGNEELRSRLSLPKRSQRRPLHMAVLRGDLPLLNGHCVDGAKTRVTVTSQPDREGRIIWQIGGQVAEKGVNLSPVDHIRFTHSELSACLPGIELSRAEWTTYRADRAEPATGSGERPDDAGLYIDRIGATMIPSAWPTKLALAPRLAERVLQELPVPASEQRSSLDALEGWPRPEVAPYPWDEDNTEWITISRPGR